MKRNIIFTGIIVLIVLTSSLLTSCSSCGDRRTSVSSLPGVYCGEASIVLPDHVKAMLNTDPKAKKLVPEGPVPCKIKITADTNQQLTLQLVDFIMPVRGIAIAPAPAIVTPSPDGIFNLKGNGNVTFGTRKIAYSHEGKINRDSLALNITVSVIPLVIEPKIVFKGEKTKR